MKKHNASKVVLITTLLFLLLTWILPAAYYSGEYVDQGRTQMGLFDLFNYPITSLSYFGYIALFLILVGGFYGVLYKIPAYRSFLDKIVEKVRGKEKFVLGLFVVLIAALVSICGVHIGIALFIPFIVSLVLLMGYDKVVAAFVTVGSIAVGLIGTTYANSNLSVLRGALSLEYDYQLWVRFIILLVGVILVIFNTLMYIKKNSQDVKISKRTIKEDIPEEKEEVKEVKVEVKKTTTKTTKGAKKSSKNKKSSTKSRRSDNKAALKEEEVIIVREAVKEESFVPQSTTGKHRIWPFVILFTLLFVLFVLAFLPWEQFKVTLFSDITKSVQEYQIYKFPIFGKLLGSFNAFGNWTITDLFLPMAMMILLLTIIYKVRVNDVIDGFVEGAKKALAPATIVVLLYSILVLVTYHPFQLPIYKWILGWAKGFNVITTSLVGLLCSLFNSDIAYSFQSVIPYFTSVISDVKDYTTAGIIFQSMYGLAMLFVPTSLTLMGTLAFLNVSYKEWLKNSWKLLLELFIVLLIAFIILA